MSRPCLHSGSIEIVRVYNGVVVRTPYSVNRDTMQPMSETLCFEDFDRLQQFVKDWWESNAPTECRIR